MFPEITRRCIAALLLGAILLLGGCKEEVAEIGALAPTLAAFDLKGNQVSLEQWRGKYVYLNFWASNCGACLAEMPVLERLSRSFKDSIVVVGVNTDREAFNIDTLLDDIGVTYPNVRDQMAMTQERYQVIGTPTAFLIAPDGKVLDQYIGRMTETQLAAIFVQAQGEQP